MCTAEDRNVYICSGDTASLKDPKDFLAFHNAEFTDRVSSPALRLKTNTLREFSDDVDLQKMKLYQLQMIEDEELFTAVEQNNSLWH